MKATWSGRILAESDDTVVVEDNHYFPPDSINLEFFQESDHQTSCPWKGTAHYYDLVVGGECNENAAWYYPETTEAANNIKGHIAFWHGVDIDD